MLGKHAKQEKQDKRNKRSKKSKRHKKNKIHKRNEGNNQDDGEDQDENEDEGADEGEDRGSWFFCFFDLTAIGPFGLSIWRSLLAFVCRRLVFDFCILLFSFLAFACFCLHVSLFGLLVCRPPHSICMFACLTF